MTSHRVGDRGAQLQVFGGVSREAQFRVRVRGKILSIDNPDAIEAALFNHSCHRRKGAGNREGDHPDFRIGLVHDDQTLCAYENVSTLARESAMFECGAGAQAHFARHYFFFASWTSERRLYRTAAVPMHQLNRRAGATSHPAVAPGVQYDDQGKQIDAFLGQSILEPARTFLVLDAREDSVADQLAEAMGEAMRREIQVLLHRVEAADTEKHVAHDHHRPAVADD